MNRKLPRSFFWIDQEIVRKGLWTKLTPQSRLAYVAIAATCDRDGLSIWSRNKLMEIAGIKDPEHWQTHLTELHSHSLIEIVPEHCPPGLRIIPIEKDPHSGDGAVSESPLRLPSSARPQSGGVAPIVIHTHTSIHLAGEKGSHVESGRSE